MSKFLKIAFFASLLAMILLPQVVFAVDCSKGMVPCGIDCNNNGKIDVEERCTICHFFKVLQSLVTGCSVAIFTWAFIYVIIGGIMILTSGGSPERVTQGKRTITYAAIGILVALGAWVIINTFMNALVGNQQQAVEEGRIPWPWNKIECAPSQGGGDDGDDTTKGEYCVCEIPRYSIKPDILGKDIRVTKLSDVNACKQACVLGNMENYCPNSSLATLSGSDYNIYCAEQASVNSKQVCRLKLGDASSGQGCRLGTICYDSANACSDAAATTYESKCYLDSQAICDAGYKGFSAFCPTGAQKTLCGSSSSKYVLYKWREEKLNPPPGVSTGNYNAFQCSNDAYGNTGFYCRLDCKYEKCETSITNTCNQLNPPSGQKASCFGGNFVCQQGVADQLDDACDELKDLLTCMAGKNMPAAAKEISSISDNSPPIAGSLPGCFRNWTSQCSGTNDSCSGTCCGHSKCSLHYGGKAPVSNEGPTDCPGQGSADCRDCSWAVDFANESYYQGIKNTAETCAKELWDGDFEKVDVVLEENHVHVELDGIAAYHRCK